MGCGCNGNWQAPVRGTGRRFTALGTIAIVRRAPDAGEHQAHGGACCAACAVGAPCGSEVTEPSPDWELRGRFSFDADAGDPETVCNRRPNETVEAYRERCGLGETGMVRELWDTMNTRERQAYLREVARESGLTARGEQQLIAGAINGGFNTLLTLLRNDRDVRIEEIRADRDVRIAQIRGAASGERDYLGSWETPGGTTTAPPPPASTQSSSQPLVTVAALAAVAKLAGIF